MASAGSQTTHAGGIAGEAERRASGARIGRNKTEIRNK